MVGSAARVVMTFTVGELGDVKGDEKYNKTMTGKKDFDKLIRKKMTIILKLGSEC